MVAAQLVERHTANTAGSITSVSAVLAPAIRLAKRGFPVTPKYQQMGHLLSDAVAYIPLYYSVGAFLFKPYVKGAGTNNFFDRYWNEISILQH